GSGRPIGREWRRRLHARSPATGTSRPRRLPWLAGWFGHLARSEPVQRGRSDTVVRQLPSGIPTLVAARAVIRTVAVVFPLVTPSPPN
ncbi:hypothetical protein, partial [Microbacterium aurantiacum]